MGLLFRVTFCCDGILKWFLSVTFDGFIGPLYNHYMKNQLIIFTLLLSTVLSSSPSYADWTKVGTNVSGNNFYVDYEKIKKQNGYVYWWSLLDFSKALDGRYLSHKVYTQGDCALSRFLTVSSHLHRGPMGKGNKDTSKPPKEWRYPSLNSVNKTILKSVCSW